MPKTQEVKKAKTTQKAPAQKAAVSKRVATPKVKSAPVKTVKTTEKVAVPTSKSGEKEMTLVASVLGIKGEAQGKMTLPKELFGAKVNQPLLATAVRVYLANQREGSASTKTRGEVTGSTRKIYRQKGTGRARHGAITAPIFVGGGIVFGPRPRSYTLKLPEKMRKAALASALTAAYTSGNIIFVDGMETLVPKTKQFVQTLTQVGASGSTLLVVPEMLESVLRGARNIDGVEVIPAANLNAYVIVSHQKIVMMKHAVSVVAKRFEA